MKVAFCCLFLAFSLPILALEPALTPADPTSTPEWSERVKLLRAATAALGRMPQGADHDAIDALIQDVIQRMEAEKAMNTGLRPLATTASPTTTAAADLAKVEMKRPQLEALLASTADLPKDHVRLKDGRKIALTSVTMLAPTGLRFIGNGIELVKWENIDPYLAQAYGWSEDIQAEYEAWKKTSAVENERQLTEAKRAAQEQEVMSMRKAERERVVNASRSPVFVRISQVIKSGALGYGARIERPKYSWEQSFSDYLAGKVEFITSDEHDEPVFIVGLPGSLVDGDKWAGWLYPCGQYSYTTVAGGQKTVRKYATTARQALSVLDGAE